MFWVRNQGQGTGGGAERGSPLSEDPTSVQAPREGHRRAHPWLPQHQEGQSPVGGFPGPATPPTPWSLKMQELSRHLQSGAALRGAVDLGSGEGSPVLSTAGTQRPGQPSRNPPEQQAGSPSPPMRPLCLPLPFPAKNLWGPHFLRDVRLHHSSWGACRGAYGRGALNSGNLRPHDGRTPCRGAATGLSAVGMLHPSDVPAPP